MALARSPAERSRGLTYSSMPKLISDSATPSSAMQRPAGTYHHQKSGKAPFCCAQNRMVPQLRLVIGMTPMNASVVRPSTAAVTVPTKLEAMIAMRFGSISTVMIRQQRLAVRLRRLDEVAVAQRHRLRAQHPRRPMPIR